MEAFEDQYMVLAEELCEKQGYWPTKRQVLNYYFQLNGDTEVGRRPYGSVQEVLEDV